jgi:hypothetical protein
VLLTKGIDNQILTSFRTLTKANNVVSDTLKIVHTKFSPTPMSLPMKNRLKKALYVINEEVFSTRRSLPTEEEEPPQENNMLSLDRLSGSLGGQPHPSILPKDDSIRQLDNHLRNSKSIVYQQAQPHGLHASTDEDQTAPSIEQQNPLNNSYPLTSKH